MSALPNKLSALLRLAVADAQACEAMPETYRLDMTQWHTPPVNVDGQSRRSCSVCMAGAVMAQSLETPPKDSVDPGSFDFDTNGKLLAIDSLRSGDIWDACDHIGVDPPDGAIALEKRWQYEYEGRTGYGSSAMRFEWPEYLEMANELEALGL